jgi:hypothetical protein
MAKKSSVKSIKVKKIWGDSEWTVRFGSLNAGPGAAGGVKRLFRVVGEKIPFEAINKVNGHLRGLGVRREGVYVAHDSMGYVGTSVVARSSQGSGLAGTATNWR